MPVASGLAQTHEVTVVIYGIPYVREVQAFTPDHAVGRALDGIPAASAAAVPAKAARIKSPQ